MARDYQQAKIYCIKVNTEEEYLPYVGSSCKRLLSQRMNQHRQDFDKWKKGKYGFLSSFTLFEKFGIENCYIELVELFPCKCNDELRKKEREYIDKIKCVNMDRPFRTKEEAIQQKKNHAEENKIEIAEKRAEKYRANKEEIAEKKKEKYDCPCGSTLRISDKSTHEKTKKHKNYLTTIGTLCSTAVTQSP
jgi:hypothetical protein